MLSVDISVKFVRNVMFGATVVIMLPVAVELSVTFEELIFAGDVYF